MKTNLEMFRSDKDREKNGVHIEVADGVRFHVRRFNETNPSVKAAFAKYYKPHAHQIQMGSMDPAKEHEILVRVFVESCVMGWEGVEIDGDTEFSKEKAVKLLVDLPDLFTTLYDKARDFAVFRQELGN